MRTKDAHGPADLITRETVADPYPTYAALREHSPCRYSFHPSPRPGVDSTSSWALLRYDDVLRVLRDHEAFSAREPPWIGVKLTMLHDDPPRHMHLRRLVNTTFTLKRIERLEPWIRRVVDGLLDSFEAREAEVMSAFASPLPVKVIAALLGVPAAEYPTLKDWSGLFFSPSSLRAGDRLRSIRAMMEFFGKIAIERRAHAADDLISALLSAEPEGEPLSEAELLGFCILLLISGSETSSNLGAPLGSGPVC